MEVPCWCLSRLSAAVVSVSLARRGAANDRRDFSIAPKRPSHHAIRLWRQQTISTTTAATAPTHYVLGCAQAFGRPSVWRQHWPPPFAGIHSGLISSSPTRPRCCRPPHSAPRPPRPTPTCTAAAGAAAAARRSCCSRRCRRGAGSRRRCRGARTACTGRRNQTGFSKGDAK